MEEVSKSAKLSVFQGEHVTIGKTDRMTNPFSLIVAEARNSLKEAV